MQAGIQVEDLWKRFQRGQFHDSLRDLLPALARRVLGRRSTARELGKDDFWALRELSFAVAPGQALGVIGPNGAGKSTLLKLVHRILRPTRGRIQVHGRVGALIEIAAGFHPDLTGRENIFLQGAILGMRRHEIQRHFDAIVAFSEIEAFIDTPVKRYSSGMNARLGFSIATSLEQEVLIIDEVLSVGDWAFQVKCAQRMQQLVQGGAAVLFVSHNTRAICELCTQTMLLVSGSCRALGTSEAVVREYLAGNATVTSVPDAPVRIARAALCGADGAECWEFVPAQDAIIEVDLEALGECPLLFATIYILDAGGYLVFNTSNVRLGDAPLTLRAGETRRVRFGVTLHLAPGQYTLGVRTGAHAQGKILSTCFPAATLLIQAEHRMTGCAHLEPRVL